ncbi:hypothetical protein AGATL06_25170 [Agathobaculum sp. TL06]
MHFVELSHIIRNGLVSYPGMPPVKISAYLTRDQCGGRFGGASAALLDQISMVNISGTYIDAPYHRYETGYKVCDIPLEKCFDLPTFVVDLGDSTDELRNPVFTQADIAQALAQYDLHGAAVLLRSGHDKKFMTPSYEQRVPYCSLSAAEWLIVRGVYVLGIDTQLIDDFNQKSRGDMVHDLVLQAGSVICEDMKDLDLLPLCGARLYVIAPRVEMASFPARVFAVIPD